MENKQMTLKPDNAEIATTDEKPDIMQAIMAMSKDKEFDADKMAVLVGMKNDHEDREAKKAFNHALVEFKKSPPRS